METTQRLEELQSHIEELTQGLSHHEEEQATLTSNQRAAAQHCLIHLRAVAAHNGPMMEAAIVQVATEILLRQATAELAMIRAKAH